MLTGSAPYQIADRAELCGSFFHVEECFEWQNEVHCLVVDQCQRVVHGIACVTRGEDVLWAALYHNCWMGDTQHNIHFEEFATRDPDLLELLKQTPEPLTLTFYITYQPCHHSSGRRFHQGHGKSCTKIICRFVDEVLSSYPQVTFRIVCANIYRAHWEDPELFNTQEDAEAFSDRTALAREGLACLFRKHIQVEGFTQTDWDRLLSWCKPCTLTKDDWEARRACDKMIDSFLQRLAQRVHATTPS